MQIGFIISNLIGVAKVFERRIVKVFWIFSIFLASCIHTSDQHSTEPTLKANPVIHSDQVAEHFKSLFSDREACFIMKRISTGETIESYNPQRCTERFSPNSTFKIPAALMAFEKGVLKTEDQVIKWDGKKYGREEENQDQTPISWMGQSVVWVTQWMIPKIKAKDLEFYLKQFEYGNQDFSGGSARAWLDSSLKISADEQVAFLNQLWQETLPLSKATFEKTKKIIFIKKLNSTTELYGKTGTSCAIEGCGTKSGHRRGWFVGVVKTKNDAYVFAANAQDLKPQSGYAGPRLRNDITQILSDMKLD